MSTKPYLRDLEILVPEENVITAFKRDDRDVNGNVLSLNFRPSAEQREIDA
jgi:hypothetical protein